MPPRTDFSKMLWLDHAWKYYQDRKPEFEGQNPKILCQHIARTRLKARSPDEVNWVASRMHEHFLANGYYEPPFPDLIVGYVGMEPIPDSLKFTNMAGWEWATLMKVHEMAVEIVPELALAHGSASQGLATSARTGSDLLPGLRAAYPMIRRAANYYHQNWGRAQFGNKSASAQCLEIAREALGCKSNQENAEYMASRVFDVFLVCQMPYYDERPTYWTHPKNLWEVGRVISDAILEYTWAPQDYGKDSSVACKLLAQKVIGTQTDELTAYVASRIYDAFTHTKTQAWRSDRTVLRGQPQWYVPTGYWWLEDGTFI